LDNGCRIGGLENYGADFQVATAALGGRPARSPNPKRRQGLKKNSVNTAKLKKNAVTTAKIRNGAVTGAKIKISSLGTVPSA
jgi:hypothetical protein